MNPLTFEVTAQDFAARVLDSTTPVLIEFTADWCPPFKMLAPTLNEIAGKYEDKLHVGLLDADTQPDIVQQYGVMGLPTLILFVNGAPVERIVGYLPRERIEAKIVPYLAAASA